VNLRFLFRDSPKIILSRICEQAMWTKANQFLRLFTPTGGNTTAFGEPAKNSFNHPTPGGKALFLRGWALIFQLIPSGPMFDLLNVVLQADKLMGLFIVIPLICTKNVVRGADVWRRCEQSTHPPTICRAQWRPVIKIASGPLRSSTNRCTLLPDRDPSGFARLRAT
jgi:hypothetical protein